MWDQFTIRRCQNLSEEHELFEADFFIPASPEHIKREKEKARVLRNSQWWKNLRARSACHYCKKQIPVKELSMDHIVPIVRGGCSTKSNIVPCCKECNNKKRYLLPIEWQEYLDSIRDCGSAEL
jgi:5-methylcytosine-specific restriction protein A